MIELDYIARKARAAREFEHQVGPATIRMRVPTKLESSIAYAESAGGRKYADPGVSLRFHRALLLLAVCGWSGVTVQHMLPSHPTPDAFDFETGAIALLLDAQPEWETELLQALLQRLSDRQTAEEAAAKN